MSKRNWDPEDDDVDWDEVEKVTRNFKGSAEEIEELLIDQTKPARKKKRRVNKFYDEEM